MKVLFAILLILISLQFGFGQEKPKAELIDRFEMSDDCDLSGRMDNLNIGVIERQSQGFIIIYENDKNPIAKYKNRRILIRRIAFARYDEQKFTIVLGKATDKTLNGMIELYELPPNAEKPYFIEIPINYELPNLVERILVATTATEDFSYIPNFEIYSKYLKSNPNIRGVIVVSEKIRKKRQRMIDYIMHELTKKYGVNHSQIRITFGRRSFSAEDYWLIPIKQRR